MNILLKASGEEGRQRQGTRFCKGEGQGVELVYLRNCIVTLLSTDHNTCLTTNHFVLV